MGINMYVYRIHLNIMLTLLEKQQVQINQQGFVAR